MAARPCWPKHTFMGRIGDLQSKVLDATYVCGPKQASVRTIAWADFARLRAANRSLHVLADLRRAVDGGSAAHRG
jgi:hypothetical protein